MENAGRSGVILEYLAAQWIQGKRLSTVTQAELAASKAWTQIVLQHGKGARAAKAVRRGPLQNHFLFSLLFILLHRLEGFKIPSMFGS